MDIIDCHTHCYPEELKIDPAKWAKARNEHHWANLVAPEDRTSIQGWSTASEMLYAMDTANVQKTVLLGWYWENETTCRWHNEFIADWVATAPDRFIGFAAIYAASKEKDVISQCEHAKSLGLQGIGELHPGIQRFSSSCKSWQTLAEWCIEHDWPINIHATEVIGRNLAGTVQTPLYDFVEMAQAHPELKLILAHWGGGLAFFELNPFLRSTLKNVYYDTAASPLLYDMSVFRRVIEIVGIGKILFGSDYPLKLYPRSQKKPDFVRFIQSIKALDLSTKDQQAIFGLNLQKLLPGNNTAV